MKHCRDCDTIKPLTQFTSNGYYKGRKKHKPTCKVCEYTRQKARYRGFMLAFYGALACSKCGYDKCVGALELHHRNPAEKEYEPSNMLNHSKESIINEFNKCDMLCANCHRETHYHED